MQQDELPSAPELHKVQTCKVQYINHDVLTIMVFDTFRPTMRNALIVGYGSKLIIQFSPIASCWRSTILSSLVCLLQGLRQVMLLKMKSKLTVQFLHSKF